MSQSIAEIGEILLRLIFETFLFWTGEIVLFLLTLGRHKPRWDFYTSERPLRFVIFSELSVWVGLAFWIFIIFIIYKLNQK